MIDTSRPCSLLLLWMTLTFKVTVIWKSRNFYAVFFFFFFFFTKFSVSMDEIWYAAMTLDLLKFILFSFFLLAGFIYKRENSISVTLKRECVRLACIWMLFNGFLSNLIWLNTWLSSTFWYLQSRPEGPEKARTYSVVNWHEVAQTFTEVEYVREMMVKKSCKYGEHELFEHLLLLIVSNIWIYVISLIHLCVCVCVHVCMCVCKSKWQWIMVLMHKYLYSKSRIGKYEKSRTLYLLILCKLNTASPASN